MDTDLDLVVVEEQVSKCLLHRGLSQAKRKRSPQSSQPGLYPKIHSSLYSHKTRYWWEERRQETSILRMILAQLRDQELCLAQRLQRCQSHLCSIELNGKSHSSSKSHSRPSLMVFSLRWGYHNNTNRSRCLKIMIKLQYGTNLL